MSAAFYEPLERRQLMSASLVNGVLTVTGTDARDQIRIDVAANGILFVEENAARRAFSTYEVRSIVVDARGGNDRIELARSVNQPATLNGGAGDDTLIGGGGADAMFGGAGTDLVDYSARKSNLTISLDDRANDGEHLERDDVRSDVENVRTGSGNDHITGSPSDDALFAGDGHNTVRGGGGNDVIVTGSGNDLVWGDTQPLPPGLAVTKPKDAAVGIVSRAPRLGGLILAPSKTPTTSAASLIAPRFIGGDLFKVKSTSSIIGAPVTTKLEYVDLVRRNYCDTILTGAGNDTIHGGDGDDGIWAGAGNDRAHGDAGDDTVRGEAGNDHLFAGAGRDELHGGDGADVLVAIGGGTDSLYGQQGGDTFWKDAKNTEYSDADFAERLVGAVHDVASFAKGVSLELDGQNLRDPSGYDMGEVMMLGDEFDPKWKSFADRPLFGPRGPQSADARQGRVQDGHLIAVLAGIARRDPHRIRQSIADLGDGTYAVKLLDDAGSPRYYRVDGDLPVNSGGAPYYAALGQAGATWVALMEKAFALHRGASGYHALRGIHVSEVFTALGMKERGGQRIYQNAWTSIDWLQAQLRQGRVVVLQTFDDPVAKRAPILNNHLYVVESVNIGTAIIRSGGREETRVMPLTVTLRNPWGSDGAGNDGADDGLVTINFEHMNFNWMFAQAWG